MLKVYCAGPYNSNNVLGVLNNIKKGIETSCKLIENGFAPFCPWLDHHFQLHSDISLNTFKEMSMEWLRVSDAVYMVEGWEESRGAIAEKEEAELLGIVVFYDKPNGLQDLIEWSKQ